MITRRGFLRKAGLATAALALPKSVFADHTPAPRPNIVLIMADDMGYSDIGCYGSEINTPALNSLAAKGLRFTHFYNTARCCPTRASLMTGLYPHQAGIGHMMNDRNLRGFKGDLNKNCMTIAEVLKTAGYSTYMAGKWHVTPHVRPGTPKHNWPLQRGYDRFYGTIHGAGSFYDPNSLTRDNTLISPFNDPEYKTDDYYYTDAIADNAARYVREHDKSSPFFMYVAFTAAHWPMHAREKDIAKYKGRYNAGWNVLRAERYKRMIELGVIDKKWAISPPDNNGWENVKRKAWQCRRMEVYAAMIDCMDRGVGRIVSELKSKGLFDDTLILYLQDNGGCAEEYGSQGAIKPDPSEPVELKPMAPDELQLKMQPTVTRDGRPVRTGRGVMPGPDDTYIAYGKQWANVSNTPFRMYKHWEHEGGISTPLIAHWPKGIESHGELRHQPGHLIDIMATCIDLSGAKYPKQYKGNEIIPFEGRSLVPAFDNREIEREFLFWEHEGNRAIRQGKWKLVAKGPKGPWELYDMEIDRSELNDLSKQYPDRVTAMAELWTTQAKRVYATPWPWDPQWDDSNG